MVFCIFLLQQGVRILCKLKDIFDWRDKYLSVRKFSDRNSLPVSRAQERETVRETWGDPIEILIQSVLAGMQSFVHLQNEKAKKINARTKLYRLKTY